MKRKAASFIVAVVGALSLTAFAAGSQSGAPQAAAPAHPGMPPSGNQPMMSEEALIKQQIARVDANHDGKISLDEYLAPAKEAFANMDKNHDGFITVDEVMAARQERMAEMEKAREAAIRAQEAGQAHQAPADKK